MKRNRKQQIIWFNSPFNLKIKTKIGKTFLHLLHRYFRAHKKKHKIFNRNNVKISYSCMPPMTLHIDLHVSISINQSINQSICLSVCLSVYLSICMHIDRQICVCELKKTFCRNVLSENVYSTKITIYICIYTFVYMQIDIYIYTYICIHLYTFNQFQTCFHNLLNMF